MVCFGHALIPLRAVSTSARTMLYHRTYLCLGELRQPHPDGVRVRLEPLTLCQRHNRRAELAEPVRGELLARDVLLERESVDARELPRKTVGRQRVVGARGVVTA